MEKFLLTRPSRGATEDALKLMLREYISTHTPLAGRDTGIAPVFYTYEFLLTRPSRGATRLCDVCPNQCRISTHTPLAGRDTSTSMTAALRKISTHTPLAGRDFQRMDRRKTGYHFYSHAPRGARRCRHGKLHRKRKFLLTRPSRGATFIVRSEPF